MKTREGKEREEERGKQEMSKTRAEKDDMEDGRGDRRQEEEDDEEERKGKEKKRERGKREEEKKEKRKKINGESGDTKYTMIAAKTHTWK